jgi:hypothetical protein
MSLEKNRKRGARKRVKRLARLEEQSQALLPMPTNKGVPFQYMKRPNPNENMITIKLASLLMQEGIEFDTEYNPSWMVPGKKRKSEGYRGARFDLIIIKLGYVVGIVEVKGKSTRVPTTQVSRYEKWGVPVFLCAGEKRIEKTLEFCRWVYNAWTNLPGSKPEETVKPKRVIGSNEAFIIEREAKKIEEPVQNKQVPVNIKEDEGDQFPYR